MKFIIGPIIHRQKFSSPVSLTVIPIKTKFKTVYRGSWDYTGMVTRLTQDEERNRQIAARMDKAIDEGNSVLVLSRRIEHLELVQSFMENESEILTGRLAKAERKRIISGLRDGSIRCVLSTQLADEALDVPRLNRVALIHPGKHDGRIIQQVGRAIRMHPDKENAVIYDFIDYRISILRRQWNLRRQAYKQAGIKVRRRKMKIA